MSSASPKQPRFEEVVQHDFVSAYHGALFGLDVNALVLTDDWLAGAHEEFLANGAVRVPNVFSEVALATISAEATRLCTHELNRDFSMPGYETPRRMSVCGGQVIVSHSPYLAMLYFHRQLRFLVQRIVGVPMHSVPHVDEFMVVNRLKGVGQTHGWHLDDPKFALVIVVDTPPRDSGGFVEVIPNWAEFAYGQGLDPTTDLDKAVPRALELGLVRRVDLDSGDAYVLNAGECLHRVVPITTPNMHRCAVNLAFDDRLQPIFGSTAKLLYSANA